MYIGFTSYVWPGWHLISQYTYIACRKFMHHCSCIQSISRRWATCKNELQLWYTYLTTIHDYPRFIQSISEWIINHDRLYMLINNYFLSFPRGACSITIWSTRFYFFFFSYPSLHFHLRYITKDDRKFSRDGLHRACILRRDPHH